VVTQVKELQLRSFRGIDRLDLKFHPRVSVFLGVNGVGKSTILDALSVLLYRAYILSTTNLGFNNYNELMPDQNIYMMYSSTLESHILNQYETEKARRIDLQDIKNGDKICCISIGFTSDSKNVEWSVQQDINSYKGVQKDEWNSLSQFIVAIQQKTIENPTSSVPLLTYYSTRRIVSEASLNISDDDNSQRRRGVQFSSSSSIVEPSSAQFSACDGISGKNNTGFSEFFRWFKSIEDLENESRRDDMNYRNPQLNSVRKALPVFLDGFSDLRVRRSPTLRMTVTKGDRELLVNQLSDGEKCLLAMVGDIARRLSIANPGLDDPLQGEGVILIDELELHLHPKWQRGIIPKLTETFPNCQFIVATHSPQIVSDVQPESIFILKSTDCGVIVEHPDHSFGRDSNQILEDLMGVSDRPEAIKTQLQDLFELIENGELDQAKQVKNHLEHLMGLDEPEFAKADVLIRRREILGR
jgi:predicted ATP-binding protein involved in virulence